MVSFDISRLSRDLIRISAKKFLRRKRNLRRLDFVACLSLTALSVNCKSNFHNDTPVISFQITGAPH